MSARLVLSCALALLGTGVARAAERSFDDSAQQCVARLEQARLHAAVHFAPLIEQHPQASEVEVTMDYIVVVEKAQDGSYSAYVPDLPGCTACGDTLDEVRKMIEEAVSLHLASLRSHGEKVPSPNTIIHTVHAA